MAHSNEKKPTVFGRVGSLLRVLFLLIFLAITIFGVLAGLAWYFSHTSLTTLPESTNAPSATTSPDQAIPATLEVTEPKDGEITTTTNIAISGRAPVNSSVLLVFNGQVTPVVTSRTGVFSQPLTLTVFVNHLTLFLVSPSGSIRRNDRTVFLVKDQDIGQGEDVIYGIVRSNFDPEILITSFSGDTDGQLITIEGAANLPRGYTETGIPRGITSFEPDTAVVGIGSWSAPDQFLARMLEHIVQPVIIRAIAKVDSGVSFLDESQQIHNLTDGEPTIIQYNRQGGLISTVNQTEIRHDQSILLIGTREKTTTQLRLEQVILLDE